MIPLAASECLLEGGVRDGAEEVFEQGPAARGEFRKALAQQLGRAGVSNADPYAYFCPS